MCWFLDGFWMILWLSWSRSPNPFEHSGWLTSFMCVPNRIALNIILLSTTPHFALRDIYCHRFFCLLEWCKIFWHEILWFWSHCHNFWHAQLTKLSQMLNLNLWCKRSHRTLPFLAFATWYTHTPFQPFFWLSSLRVALEVFRMSSANANCDSCVRLPLWSVLKNP